jgi:5'(3')-deoxyribonucleotidase
MKQNKLTIFLDLDGVIADFITAAMSALNVTYYTIPPDEPNIEKWPGVNVSTKEFWSAIDKTNEDFWFNILKYDYSDELVRLCHSYGEVFFLTSPSRNPACLSGKMMWIKKHYPRMARNAIMTPAKYLCAAPNRVLIDDTEAKVDKFIEYGGSAILFPQPYNRAWHGFDEKITKVQYVKNCLDYLVKIKEIK